MSLRFKTLLVLTAASISFAPHAQASGYNMHNLISNRQIYNPDIIDPHMINAWGLAIRPAGAGGHFWINNTDSGTTVLYIGDVGGVKLHQDETPVVNIPAPKGQKDHSAPTGQVFNGREDEFTVTVDGITGPSKFIFDTEDGTIVGWTEKKNEDGTFVRPKDALIMVDNSKKGAIYKGLAISQKLDHNKIYAADFGRHAIDVYDSSFKPVKLEKDAFAKPKDIPDGYAPFNIQELGGKLYVTYAKLSKEAGEETQGDGFGYLAEFDYDGKLLRVLEGDKALNAPWGLAIGSEHFGEASGKLLVGNFGDGKIVTYDLASGKQDGTLNRPDGQPIEIEGLWGLIYGNGESLGDKDALYFSAGPADEKNGVFGKLTVAQ